MQSVLNFIAILILLTIFLSCESNTNNIAPPNTKIESKDEFPAFNRELIIDIKSDSIAAYALIASGESLKETVILIAGYPGNDNNFDIAQAIRRQGKNVIHFNHRGAWGSQGNYTYSNCLEDIRALIKYLSQDDLSEKLRINPNEFILLGRSYGGGIALLEGSQIDAVKKIIAISSVNYGVIMENYESLEDLTNFKKYMKKQIMIQTNIDDFLQEMLDNKSKFNIVNYKDALKDKKVLLIEDSKKNEDWIKELETAEYLLMESDHNFIDKRLDLTNLIINWIEN